MFEKSQFLNSISKYSVDSTTYVMTPNSKGNCMPADKVNDCPIGFRWAYSEATCYRVVIM